jgi:hypothetical protein
MGLLKPKLSSLICEISDDSRVKNGDLAVDIRQPQHQHHVPLRGGRRNLRLDLPPRLITIEETGPGIPD